jgi:hypothetical protein
MAPKVVDHVVAVAVGLHLCLHPLHVAVTRGPKQDWNPWNILEMRQVHFFLKGQRVVFKRFFCVVGA